MAMTPAEALLALIDPRPGLAVPNVSPDQAMNDVLSELDRLHLNHVRWKQWALRFQAERCFSHPTELTDHLVIRSQCKVHLSVAIKQLKRVVVAMKNGAPTISAAALAQFGPIMRDFLFDLRPIILFLELPKNPSYVFFHGGSNPGVLAFELFAFGRQLAMASTRAAIPVDYKLGQIASTFVLRQAMEAKFDRLIAVDLHDKKGLAPKLRHGFHYEFIRTHPAYFQFNAVDFEAVKHVYDWASGVVHEPAKPLAWQLLFADEICGPLFRPPQPVPGKAWSVNGAVTIHNQNNMQRSFAEYFLAYYEHGDDWALNFLHPEAAVASS